MHPAGVSAGRLIDGGSVVAGHEQAIAWGEEAGGLRLGVSMEGLNYARGATPVSLKIFIGNVSAEKIQIVETRILQEYDIELTRDGGQRVAMTAEGLSALQAAESPDAARRIVITIEPGSVREVRPPVLLSEWFHLEDAGSYTVRVSRKDWPGGEGRLVSGPVVFHIN